MYRRFSPSFSGFGLSRPRNVCRDCPPVFAGRPNSPAACFFRYVGCAVAFRFFRPVRFGGLLRARFSAPGSGRGIRADRKTGAGTTWVSRSARRNASPEWSVRGEDASKCFRRIILFCPCEALPNRSLSPQRSDRATIAGRIRA